MPDKQSLIVHLSSFIAHRSSLIVTIFISHQCCALWYFSTEAAGNSVLSVEMSSETFAIVCLPEMERRRVRQNKGDAGEAKIEILKTHYARARIYILQFGLSKNKEFANMPHQPHPHK